MYTEFSVIIDSSTVTDKQQLIHQAKQVFRTVDDLAFWYTSVTPADNKKTVVALDSPSGEALLKDRIEQTAAAKADKLQTVLDEVESAESIEQAVKSRSLVMDAKAIGAWNDPTGYLIDGAYSRGRPVLSRNDVSEIRTGDTTGEEFVLVNVKARY